jgi:predicted dehydrogenase
MDQGTLGFGVVGLGMGMHHCKAVSEARGARLVAVCDIDHERLEPAAAEYGVKAYSDYTAMLQDDEIDVVNIATPSGMHADMAIEGVAAGKHLLIEKPVDVDLARIQRLRRVVGEAETKVAVIFQSRTQPLNRRIKSAIDEGRFGRLVGLHTMLPSYRTDDYYRGQGGWRGTWALDGGGSLMNQGVHTVDLLQWLGGRVASVFGGFGVYAHDIEAEDKTAAFLRFANGALGTLNTTTVAYGGVPRIVLIHGEKGTVCTMGELRSWKLMDDPEGEEEAELLRLYGPKDERSEEAAVAVDPMAVGSVGHTFQIEDLVQAVREDRDPFVTIEDAVHAVEIVNAIYESGRHNREVAIPSADASAA